MRLALLRSAVGTGLAVALAGGGLATPAQAATHHRGAHRHPAVAADTPAPVNLHPDDTASVVKDPVLSWSSVTGATSYQVQLSPNSAFTNNLTLDKSGIPTNRFEPPQTLPHADYYWRVRATTGDGVTPWSALASFTRGWMAAPQHLAYDSSNYRFSWDPMLDASAYEIEFSTTPDFPRTPAPVQQSKNDTKTTITTAAASSTNLPLTGPGPLTVDGAPVADGNFVLLMRETAPADSGVYYVVTAGNDATPYQLAYAGDGTAGNNKYDVVRVNGGDTFGNTLWQRRADGSVPLYQRYQGTNTCTVNHPSYTFSNVAYGRADVTDGACLDWATFLLPGTTYYWRVRGRDGTDAAETGSATDPAVPCAGISYEDSAPPAESAVPECSLWSPAQSFVMPPEPTVYGAPDAEPANVRAGGDCTGGGGLYECRDTPTLTWDPVERATWYDVYVGFDPAFTNQPVIYRTLGTSLSPAGSWADAASRSGYYIAVQACNAFGCGPVAQLNVRKSSDPVALSEPATGARLRTAHPTLRWQDFLAVHAGALQEARNYSVQVAANPDFTSPMENVMVDRAGETSGLAEHTVQAALGNGTYYWRVTPYDGSHQELSPSATGTFTVDTDAPVATITTQDGMPVDGRVGVAFSEPVTGVTASSLRLVAADGTQVPARVTADADSATIDPTGLLVPGQTYRLYATTAITDAAGNPVVVADRSVRTSTTVGAGNPSLRETWAVAPYAGTGDYYAEARERGAVTSLAFAGTSVAVTGVLRHDGGVAAVYLDGARRGDASFYAPTGSAQDGREATVLTLGGLPAGAHRLDLVTLGARPIGSTDVWVRVSSFTVVNAGTTTTYQERAHDRTGRVSERWARVVATDATYGVVDTSSHVAQSGVSTPKVSATVVGSAVAVKLCKSPVGGYAAMYVDGVYRTSVSLYQSYTACGVTTWSTGVPPGPHTITVGVSGTRPSGSAGTRVGFDSFVLK